MLGTIVNDGDGVGSTTLPLQATVATADFAFVFAFALANPLLEDLGAMIEANADAEMRISTFAKIPSGKLTPEMAVRGCQQ